MAENWLRNRKRLNGTQHECIQKGQMRARIYFWFVWSMPDLNETKQKKMKQTNVTNKCTEFLFSNCASIIFVCCAYLAVCVFFTTSFTFILVLIQFIVPIQLVLWISVIVVFFIHLRLYVVYIMLTEKKKKFKPVHYRQVNENWPFEDLSYGYKKIERNGLEMADTENTSICLLYCQSNFINSLFFPTQHTTYVKIHWNHWTFALQLMNFNWWFRLVESFMFFFYFVNEWNALIVVFIIIMMMMMNGKYSGSSSIHINLNVYCKYFVLWWISIR